MARTKEIICTKVYQCQKCKRKIKVHLPSMVVSNCTLKCGGRRFKLIDERY